MDLPASSSALPTYMYPIILISLCASHITFCSCHPVKANATSSKRKSHVGAWGLGSAHIVEAGGSVQERKGQRGAVLLQGP